MLNDWVEALNSLVVDKQIDLFNIPEPAKLEVVEISPLTEDPTNETLYVALKYEVTNDNGKLTYLFEFYVTINEKGINLSETLLAVTAKVNKHLLERKRYRCLHVLESNKDITELIYERQVSLVWISLVLPWLDCLEDFNNHYLKGIKEFILAVRLPDSEALGLNPTVVTKYYLIDDGSISVN